MTELSEQEIAKKLEEMRVDAILDLHEWSSTKGHGFIINKDGSIYDYEWFLGFNNKTNSFGMCTSLDKRDSDIDCNKLKDYLEKDILIFSNEFENNFESDHGCDIIVKIDGQSKYSNNLDLYNRILNDIDKIL